jgi:predicted flap endonuclease-1-like 5' DNA nuclease
MAYLIWQLVVPLTIAAVFGGGLAGWSWHCVRTRDAWQRRNDERERLRNELLAHVGYAPDQGVDSGAELQALQLRVDAAREQVESMQREIFQRDEIVSAQRSRIAELEMDVAGARQELADGNGQAHSAALEAALREAEAKAAELDRRATELQAALDAAAANAQPPTDVAALRWRIRELESQAARHEAEAAIETVAAPAAAHPDLEDALLRQHWQARYLQARVRYLEEASKAPAPEPQPVVAPSPVDEEAENRRRWRQRYLEARVAWLEGRARDGMDARARLGADVADRDARIGALEAQLAAPREDDARIPELTRRVAELEGALAAARAETGHAGRRIADLEAGIAGRDARIALLQQQATAAPPADPEAGSLRWRSRYLDSRVRHLEQALAATSAPVAAPPPPPRDDTFAPIAPAGPEVRPEGLPAPRGGAPDDLRLIAGVSPRIESTLNSLGVYHFDQIAAWSPANIDWIERYLAFKGRIGREGWVAQARELALGTRALA